MDTELILAAVTLLIAGAAMTTLGAAQRAGKLRRNIFAGIRTLRTLRDDAAWQRAHAGTWLPLVASGVLLAIGGGAALLSRPDSPEVATAVLLVPAGLAAAILVFVGIRGARAARSPGAGGAEWGR
jgi:hypothetical protein